MPDPPRAWPRRPASTYRLQLRPDFGFAAAAEVAGYLARLGVTHAYLSPILQAAPGSRHGYDVVDHSRISAELGGEEGFRAMAARFASRGIGLVVDVVPNHMAVPAPEFLNRQLWSVLRHGQDSPHAHWFDVDWDVPGGQLLLPILARPPRHCLDQLTVRSLNDLPEAAAMSGGDELVLCYQDHVLPLRPGTEGLSAAELLSAQHYRLGSWRSAATELNWRRFFDISSLIAIRVEEPDVFASSHAVLLGLVAEGLIDGLRIDHPDGLADPRDYLRRLATAGGGAWIVAEKILCSGEKLPADWPCGGTTGYDSLAAIGELFTDPAGTAALSREYVLFGGDIGDFAAQAWAARREVAGQPLTAEVARLARLLGRLGDATLDAAATGDLRLILAELLAGFNVYRAYVSPGERASKTSAARVTAAAALARGRLPARLQPAADEITALLLGRSGRAGGKEQAARDEFMVRFQQTCAAVQAKGVEDTAAYRWTRLVSANEVGADPDHPGRSLAAFHRFAGRLCEDWPATMTTLSTHDAKRQEDVRARLAVLAESPDAWGQEVSAWHRRAAALAGAVLPDPPTEYLFWQTLVGAWPLNGERLEGYLRKAMREAKLSTSWTDPDPYYEAAVLAFARQALADAEITSRVTSFAGWISPDALANSLGAKIVQLTMPGVPDVYQGCELSGLSLVDPDNRRPVDFARRKKLLKALDEAGPARPGKRTRRGLDTAKLLVTSRALRLRREHPAWFSGDYQPLRASGEAAAHAVAFCRDGHAVTLATRLPGGLRRGGGWRDTTLALPEGRWRDVLTGTEHGGRANAGRGQHRLAELTAHLPVALLVRADDEGRAGWPRSGCGHRHGEAGSAAV